MILRSRRLRVACHTMKRARAIKDNEPFVNQASTKSERLLARPTQVVTRRDARMKLCRIKRYNLPGITLTDLFEFGLIPEFTGRLPIIANFQNLNKEMLVRIMSVPKNSIYRQYIEIFRAEGVELSISPRVFEQISEIAIEYKTGARSLRGIFEELMTPVLYVVPDNPDIHRVEIVSLFEEPRLIRRS